MRARAARLVRQARCVRARLRRRRGRRRARRASPPCTASAAAGRRSFTRARSCSRMSCATRTRARTRTTATAGWRPRCSRRSTRSGSTTPAWAPFPASTAPATTASAPGGSSSSASPSGSSAARRARRACSWCAGGDLVRAVLEPVYAAHGARLGPGHRRRPRRRRHGRRAGRAARRVRAAPAAGGDAARPRATLARAEELEPAHDASVPHPDGPEAEPAKVRGASCSSAGVGPTGPTSISSRSETASTISSSSSSERPPPSRSASQVTRIIPVAHLLVADDRQAADDVALLPAHPLDVEPGQVDLGALAAPRAASCRGSPWPCRRPRMFLARGVDAHRRVEEYPGVEQAVAGRAPPWPRAARRRTARAAARRTTGGGRGRPRGGG